MFRESLLESSPVRRNQKRWPMAVAFVLESIAAGLIILIPLLSTGIIPISARVPHDMPLQMIRVASEPVHSVAGHSGGTTAPMTRVIAIADSPNAIPYGSARYSDYNNVTTEPNIPFGAGGSGPNVGICTDCKPIGPAIHKGPLVISHLSEAQLVHRVEPVYPRMAVIINLQGEVRLHAIIAKDGTIQSLSISSGHPMLAQAALDAVRQWRYRPYLLNGEPVEVETFITVNFKRDR